MIRLLLLALILTTLTLVARALVRDLRDRRQEALVARLRLAFLHGAPLAPEVRRAGVREHEWSGLRLSLPDGWRAGCAGAATQTFAVDAAGEVVLAIETLPPAQAESERAGSPEPGALPLPSGARLTKHVSVDRSCAPERVAYEWRLCWTPGGAERRAFHLRLTMPLGRASDILRESDVAAVDRAVREARLINAASASPSGPA